MIGFQEILFGFCILPLLLLLRMIYLVYMVRSGSTKISLTKRTLAVKTLICMGSGGHTTEMVKLISSLDPKKYSPRFYFMAQTDMVSEPKIIALETDVFNCKNKKTYDITKIPRSRIVSQSYFTSVFSTINSILYCIPIMTKIKPELIICNGPGTCIPICLIAFLMKLFFICNTKIIFIESICRVHTFSLSGKILMYVADNIVVHWKELEKICKRADYLGQIC